MIEVYPNLFVGSGTDLIHADDGNKGIKPEWFVVSAAKEPFHREALGYKGRGAPKDDPEYLTALRPGRLILNLVDVYDVAYISPDIMDLTTRVIGDYLGDGKKVLVHCNQGRSRSPSIALWYLHKATNALPADHDEAVAAFTELYPDYAPARGMAEFIKQNW